MIRIPAANFDFAVRGIEIEGGNDPGVDVQYPWEDAPRRYHRHRVHMHSFYIDRMPVTNAEFKKFLDATHYRPKDDHNFLRDWEKALPRRLGATNRSPGSPSKMRAPMPLGQGNACRMSGNGNTQRNPPTGGSIRGEMNGIAICFLHADPAAPCAHRPMWTRFPRVQARSACLISRAMSRSGRTNFATLIRARRSFAAELRISRADRSGISPRLIGWTNTRNIC